MTDLMAGIKRKVGITPISMAMAFLGAIAAFFLQGYFLIIILAAAAIILIYKNPQFGIVVVVVSAFLANVVIKAPSPYRIAGEIISFGTVTIVFVYLIVFPRLIQGAKYSNDHLKKLIFLISFLFGWATISLLWTHDIYHGVNVIASFLSVFIMFQIFLFLLNDKASLYNFLYSCVFVGIALGILLVVSIWYDTDKYFSISDNISLVFSLINDKNRPGGFAPHDLAASIMNRFAFIGMALIYSGRLLKKILIGLSIVFFMICSILTASKAGVLTLFIGIFLFIFANPVLRNLRIRLGIGFSLFMGFLLISGGGLLTRRIQIFLERTSDRGFLSDRIELWSKGYDKFIETYGIGVGAGGFPRYIDPVPGAHTFFGSILFELGVVGAVIFIMLVFSLVVYFRETTKACRDKEMVFIVYSFVASIISMAIQAAIEGDFHQTHVWIMLAMLAAVFKNACSTTSNISET